MNVEVFVRISFADKFLFIDLDNDSTTSDSDWRFGYKFLYVVACTSLFMRMLFVVELNKVCDCLIPLKKTSLEPRTNFTVSCVGRSSPLWVGAHDPCVLRGLKSA